MSAFRRTVTGPAEAGHYEGMQFRNPAAPPRDLSEARAATESLPRPERTGVTPLDMIRMLTLAEVAAHTGKGAKAAAGA